jgi:hypothetical protein
MQALGDLLFEDLVKRGIIKMDDEEDDSNWSWGNTTSNR